MTASPKISHYIGSDLVAIQAVIAMNKIRETSKLKEANRTEISSDHTHRDCIYKFTVGQM